MPRRNPQSQHVNTVNPQRKPGVILGNAEIDQQEEIIEIAAKETEAPHLIPVSLHELNVLVRLFDPSCPEINCKFNRLSFKLGSNKGIRRILILKCECGYSQSSYMLPRVLIIALCIRLKPTV